MTGEDQQRLEQEYAHLESEIAALDTAVRDREDAKARATEAARAIGARLARVGHFAELAGQRFDNEVARRLYWEYPDVHVAEIAHPMRVHEGTVNRHVGDGELEKPCQGGCGATVHWSMKSRTDSVRQPRLCPECTAERDRQRERDFAKWRARQDEEHHHDVEALRRAMENGGARTRYAEFPGVGGTWEVDEQGVPLALKGDGRRLL